ncbi:hypothetical protein ACROYT_G035151 [Oculina patagonica]
MAITGCSFAEVLRIERNSHIQHDDFLLPASQCPRNQPRCGQFNGVGLSICWCACDDIQSQTSAFFEPNYGCTLVRSVRQHAGCQLLFTGESADERLAFFPTDTVREKDVSVPANQRCTFFYGNQFHVQYLDCTGSWRSISQQSVLDTIELTPGWSTTHLKIRIKAGSAMFQNITAGRLVRVAIQCRHQTHNWVNYTSSCILFQVHGAFECPYPQPTLSPGLTQATLPTPVPERLNSTTTVLPVTTPAEKPTTSPIQEQSTTTGHTNKPSESTRTLPPGQIDRYMEISMYLYTAQIKRKWKFPFTFAQDRLRGCQLLFKGESADERLAFLPSNSVREKDVSVPANQRCTFYYGNQFHVQYLDCTGSWRSISQQSVLDTIELTPGWSTTRLKIRIKAGLAMFQNTTAGRLVRVAIQCERHMLNSVNLTSSCVLFKVEGTIECPYPQPTLSPGLTQATLPTPVKQRLNSTETAPSVTTPARKPTTSPIPDQPTTTGHTTKPSENTKIPLPATEKSSSNAAHSTRSKPEETATTKLADVLTPVPSERRNVNKDVVYGTTIAALALILTLFVIYITLKRRKRREDRLDVIAVGKREPQTNEAMETERSNENINTTGAGQNMVFYEIAHHENGLDVIALGEREPPIEMETDRSNENINTTGTTGHQNATSFSFD